jgi:hypothetical protein
MLKREERGGGGEVTAAALRCKEARLPLLHSNVKRGVAAAALVCEGRGEVAAATLEREEGRMWG